MKHWTEYEDTDFIIKGNQQRGYEEYYSLHRKFTFFWIRITKHIMWSESYSRIKYEMERQQNSIKRYDER